MDRFAARRKILRGSLSAPLVLTVASPAALARQSFEACLYRASQATPPTGLRAVIDAAEHDTWLRKTVNAYPGVLQGGKIKFSSNAGDPYWYRIVRSDNTAVYYPVQITSATPTQCGDGQSPESGGYPANSGHPPVSSMLSRKQVLVYVNDDGTIAGYGTCPNSGFAVTTSCFASFGGMMQL